MTEEIKQLHDQMKRIEKLVKSLSTEVLISAIDIISEELQKRSDKLIKETK